MHQRGTKPGARDPRVTVRETRAMLRATRGRHETRAEREGREREEAQARARPLDFGRYGRLPTIARLLDVHATTVWKWSKEGKLPMPRKISGNITLWEIASVLAAAERMFAEQEAAAS